MLCPTIDITRPSTRWLYCCIAHQGVNFCTSQFAKKKQSRVSCLKLFLHNKFLHNRMRDILCRSYRHTLRQKLVLSKRCRFHHSLFHYAMMKNAMSTCHVLWDRWFIRKEYTDDLSPTRNSGAAANTATPHR